MSPEVIGFIIAILFTLPTIYIVRKYDFDSWAWPLFLITLPIWYMLFGLLAWDGDAIIKELLFGLPYIAVGLAVWKFRPTLSLYILGIAWLSHGLYDYYHDWLFINPGVFSWYPMFCALVDITVGGYLIAFNRKIINRGTI